MLDGVDEVANGPSSFAALLRRTDVLHKLLRGVAFDYSDLELLDPRARYVGGRYVIELPRSSYELLCDTAVRVLDRMSIAYPRPWAAFGLPRRAFTTTTGFGTWMAELSVDYIVAHELSHIVLAHLSMLPKRSLALGLRETGLRGDVDPVPLTPLDRRALEVGADHTACWFLQVALESLVEQSPRYSRCAIPPLQSCLYFSIHLVLAHLDKYDPGRPSGRRNPFAEERHHPPSVGRANLVMEKCLLEMARSSKERRQLVASIGRAQQAVSVAVSSGAFPAEEYELLLRRPDALKVYTNRAIDRYRELAPELLKQSRWQRVQESAQRAMPSGRRRRG